jgi:hypothetical protein
LYRPPAVSSEPPQTIISVPDHTALAPSRDPGTLSPVDVATHESVVGS